MPVALPPGTWGSWLDRDLVDPEMALALLSDDDPDSIMEHRVSREVNSVKNDGPHLRDQVSSDTLF
jgi:putative SOS response-associated peptidase YedK